MIWTIISAITVFLFSLWLGYKKFVHLDQISARTFLIFATVALAVFLILRFLHDLGYFPEAIAGGFMASFYALIAGFLFGTAYRQYKNKSEMGAVEYFNRSFASDILPNLIALTLIIAGIARTSIFNDLAITPIRVTAGFSLIGLGVYGLTLHLIPEFRRKGFVLLDRTIPWTNLLSYKWASEDVLELEFKYNEIIRIYHTVIPLEDRAKVEKILNKKLIQKLEEEQDAETE